MPGVGTGGVLDRIARRGVRQGAQRQRARRLPLPLPILSPGRQHLRVRLFARRLHRPQPVRLPERQRPVDRGCVQRGQPGVRLELLPHAAQGALSGRSRAAAAHHARRRAAHQVSRRVRHGRRARHPQGLHEPARAGAPSSSTTRTSAASSTTAAMRWPSTSSAWSSRRRCGPSRATASIAPSSRPGSRARTPTSAAAATTAACRTWRWTGC